MTRELLELRGVALKAIRVGWSFIVLLTEGKWWWKYNITVNIIAITNNYVINTYITFGYHSNASYMWRHMLNLSWWFNIYASLRRLGYDQNSFLRVLYLRVESYCGVYGSDEGPLHVVKNHDDVIKWKHFPRYWPFVRGIHRSPVNSPHKGQWRGALMFTLICARINGWVNNHEAGDLRRYRIHYDLLRLKNGSLCHPNVIITLS